MSNSKATTAQPEAKKGQAAGSRSPQGAGPNPQRRPSTIDETIAKAQHGRVNVSPDKAIEMAGQLYSRGQYQQAERVCRQMIAARPANADAHNILGVSLAALGNSKEAISELKRAVKINAQAPSYYADLGEILRQASKLDEASEALDKAVALDPNNAQALDDLASSV